MWNTDIQGILQHFIDAFDNKIDVSFWDTIYKYHGKAYGGKGNVSGWISKLFYGNSSIGKQEYIEHSMESFGNGLESFVKGKKVVNKEELYDFKGDTHGSMIALGFRPKTIKEDGFSRFIWVK